MYKLVSPIGRWSYLNGCQVYGNVVWLSNKDEVNKYTLIDENGEKMTFNLDDCLVKVQ